MAILNMDKGYCSCRPLSVVSENYIPPFNMLIETVYFVIELDLEGYKCGWVPKYTLHEAVIRNSISDLFTAY